MNDRECEKCVYHSSGMCSRWNCEGTKTIEDIRIEAKAEQYLADKKKYEAVADLLNKITKRLDEVVEFLSEQ